MTDLADSQGVTHPDGQFTRIDYGPSVTGLNGLTTQQSSTATYGYGYPVISQDEAGLQKQEWIDGFGHVIEVDEPSVSGSATSGSGSVVIENNSSEEFNSFQVCYYQGGNYVCQTIDAYNSGTISVTITDLPLQRNMAPLHSIMGPLRLNILPPPWRRLLTFQTLL
jgi:hypothetical protein